MDDNDLRERVIDKRRVYGGAFISVEHWRVALPNGREAGRDVVVHPGAAVIVPVDSQGRVCLVRQFRAAAGKVLLELPAGKLDAGEEPEKCALRELEEETGLVAGRIERLSSFYATPGFCTERHHVFLARELTQGASRADEDEFVQAAFYPLEDMIEAIWDGRIEDGKTICGLLLAQRFLARGE